MRLSGQDIDETTSVLEAGLGWIVGWEKPDFVGREALVRQRDAGVTRKLVGFEMVERGIARHGYPVYVGETRVGVVTSGTRTPFLEKAIGLAYLPSRSERAGVCVRHRDSRSAGAGPRRAVAVSTDVRSSPWGKSRVAPRAAIRPADKA